MTTHKQATAFLILLLLLIAIAVFATQTIDAGSVWNEVTR